MLKLWPKYLNNDHAFECDLILNKEDLLAKIHIAKIMSDIWCAIFSSNSPNYRPYVRSIWQGKLLLLYVNKVIPLFMCVVYQV